MICDLRSDVLGPISENVLAALIAAASRQSGFGRIDDAEEAALCAEGAHMFGFEDCLFVPTGTLANQIAIRLWVKPGEGIVADQRSHLVTNESSSVSGLNGASLRLLDGVEGHISPPQVANLLAERNGSTAERNLRLVWLENTHNRAGGTVMPPSFLQDISEIAARRSMALHVDGARIWNVLAATGATPETVFAGASSAMVALNKVAGAPVGALLLGERSFIDEAAQVQKMFGGLWRPVGPLAAAARVALRQWPERAFKAHETAAGFAHHLQSILGEPDIIPVPQTNIVMLDLATETEVDRFMRRLGSGTIRVSPYRNGKVRCVFHGGINHEQACAAAVTIAKAWRGGSDR
jgi:threonine aldolase